jgi:hypothetical protein
MPRPPENRRCAAKIKRSSRNLDIAMAKGGEKAWRRLVNHDGRCWGWTADGSRYCYRHGQYTGPKTPDGRERSFAARRAGYARYVERMRAADQRLPGGRPASSLNRTPEQREQEGCEKKTRRALRDMRHRANQDRRARREAKRRERGEAAKLEARRQDFHCGLPFDFTDAAPPPDDFRDAICSPCPVETVQDREAKRLQRAYEVAELVKRAGQIAGSRFAGVPYEVDFQGRRIQPGPHSAAPWPYQS